MINQAIERNYLPQNRYF